MKKARAWVRARERERQRLWNGERGRELAGGKGGARGNEEGKRETSVCMCVREREREKEKAKEREKER